MSSRIFVEFGNENSSLWKARGSALCGNRRLNFGGTYALPRERSPPAAVDLPTERQMKMALGTFLSFAIGAAGSPPAAWISSALVHYRDELAGDEPPLEIPAFLDAAGPGEEIDVDIEPEEERA